MNKSDQRIRKFNPGTFLSDEEVIDQFVVRKRELDIMLEVLRGNIDSPSCQHVLVVAPRGRGKTMLLARIAAELNIDDGLSECLLPVRFMEESHEVLNIADFWLEALFHLARESARHDPVLAQELRETHADLRDRWREKELADRVLAAVLDASDRLGKKLVLMVENLQSIGENVDDDFGWQLRGALQSEPQIMLLATATSRFKGLDDAEQPFFEQFRILDLEPLNTEECRRLWQVVTGDEVSDHGIRPLEILTGGSPRLLVIVGEFAQHRSLSQLMEELVTLIDDHTEYFRSHLEVLASVERRVYLAVIDLWQPSNAGEIATRARKDIRTVSTLLRRLVNRGAVIVEGTGRKRMYVAAERLYSIYYKLRRERDEAAVVANLIYFMAVFYSETELAEMSDELIAEAAESKVIREGIQRALARRPQVEDFSSRIAWSAIEDISDKATSNAQFAAELCLEKEIEAAFEEEAFERVIEIVDSFVASEDADSSLMPESLIAYILHMRAIAYEKLENFQGVLTVCDEMVERFSDTRDIALLARMAPILVQRAIALIKLGDFQAAIAAYDEVIERFGDFDELLFQRWGAAALTGKGSAQGKLGEYTAAIAAYDEVIARFGDSDAFNLQISVAWALYEKGDVQVQLSEFVAAVATYDEVIARFGDSNLPDLQECIAWPLCKKGDVQVLLD
ncbi:MAG: tetratricopeptide repeat protein [Gemmatimonadetes bacterium]|nr:tetratricopeptide repeat protein [Gemmatimonadota bacterium]